MKRTFVGIVIQPDESFRQHFNRIKSVLSDEKIRWADPGHFHLTLHFFGDTREKDIGVIPNVIEDATVGFSPFLITVSGLGLFRSLKHPRVLWAGLHHNGVLSELRNKLEKGLMLHGFDGESRPFRPHLTLGRMKCVKNTGRLSQLLDGYSHTDFFDFTVSELVYFESILSPGGSVYRKLSGYELGR
ncbi:MAG TPA: RNA 2',3'-cyclic phosphodiesterase [Bacteroidales bacterium]|nr:RNA 2',3'-cyclic phosphodiesterase [Bacteroidales bacterium]